MKSKIMGAILLSLATFFILGLALLLRVDVARAAREIGAGPPAGA